MMGKKPAMRPKTLAEVQACNSCDVFGRRLVGWPAPIPANQVCWFSCETPIEPLLDPLWAIVYPEPHSDQE